MASLTLGHLSLILISVVEISVLIMTTGVLAGLIACDGQSIHMKVQAFQS